MLVLLLPHIHKVNLLTLPLQQGLALSAIPVILPRLVFTVACRVLSAIWMATFVSYAGCL